MVKIMSISSETDGGIIKNIVFLLYINFTNYFTGEETDYKTRSIYIHVYISVSDGKNHVYHHKLMKELLQKCFATSTSISHVYFTYLFHYTIVIYRMMVL